VVFVDLFKGESVLLFQTGFFPYGFEVVEFLQVVVLPDEDAGFGVEGG
jgi:hypothetical protein